VDGIFKDLDDELFRYTVGAHDVDELSVEESGLIFGQLRCSACLSPTSETAKD
jgi:hypothetical protein